LLDNFTNLLVSYDKTKVALIAKDNFKYILTIYNISSNDFKKPFEANNLELISWSNTNKN